MATKHNITTETSTLSAERTDGTWTVLDSSGSGRWWPGDFAQRLIAAAPDPAAAALALASDEPMFGTWRD